MSIVSTPRPGATPRARGSALAGIRTTWKWLTSVARLCRQTYRGRLPLYIPLASELLHAAGYVTYMQGKWHLGDLPEGSAGAESVVAPNGRGFDHFCGFLHAEAAPYPEVSSPGPSLHA